MSLLLARNLRKFLEKSSAIQLSVKNQGRSDIQFSQKYDLSCVMRRLIKFPAGSVKVTLAV